MQRLLFIPFCCCLFVSCWQNSDPEDPPSVAVAFMCALRDGDLEKARSLIAEESAATLMLGKSILDGDAELRDVFEGRWRSAACEGDDRFRTCTVCCGATGMNAALVLVREGEAWKVRLDKSGEEDIREGLEALGGIFEDIDTTGWGDDLNRVVDSLQNAAPASPNAH